MKQRTEAEWRELVARLTAIAKDREEERSRRQRALAILETVPEQYKRPLSEEEYYGADGQIA